jgi:UDP-N-acetylglucosamine 2-epimerase (non-hydrolysing)/GDP/UDP-N,N'-diacetylbacillosamine 2-epimerase (hydrolysing)
MRKKVVAIFTGNRAEYGLLYPVIKAISLHPDLECKLLVSGAHLDPHFGDTLNEIKSDGFEIYDEIKIDMETNSLNVIPNAIGSGIISISNTLAKLKPDFAVIYADRFEGLAAVVAASQMNIPTVHIEGGDLTEGGALDDSVRHAMTKLAHIHFTTNDEASERILGLGEESWRVQTVGFTAIDLIEQKNYATVSEIQSKFKLDLTQPIVLFTQHSISQIPEMSKTLIDPSLIAMRMLSEEGAQIIITYPNNDNGSTEIIKCINNFKHLSNSNVFVEKSLGRYYYHGILALALDKNNRIACVGNSSSGIKETPAFGCPTVNIGSRQEGRLRGSNVIDADYDSDEIYKATIKCLYDEKFRKISKEGLNPYWKGGAGVKVANYLANLTINQELIRKKMTLKSEILKVHDND